MNQYRCETCNHLASDRRNYCNFLKNEIHSSPLIFIELCGCASHSDFQSERDKVLDELITYAESCRSENESRGRLEHDEIIIAALAGAALAFAGMKDKIKELRREGEP
jgi:hypothetical protein